MATHTVRIFEVLDTDGPVYVDPLNGTQYVRTQDHKRIVVGVPCEVPGFHVEAETYDEAKNKVRARLPELGHTRVRSLSHRPEGGLVAYVMRKV